ncbi:energy-coupling factor transporter transmembrane component T [Lacibacterium aquatile]|uniref:Energy-coupling factor transporter transmembrane component T n=1 Tax=Lacibacterium aquatile TaxID=1168082 RepID=A0ABW5DN16_9PROT
MKFDAENDTGALGKLPPAVKLLALFVLSILLFATTSPSVLIPAASLVLIGSLLLCPSAVWQWLRSWVLLFTIAVVVGWTAYAQSLDAALVTFTRLTTLTLLATLVTTTTRIAEFIDTITTLARPLERIGIGNARDIGLAIGLAIRFIPEVQARYQSIADAHRARGLKMRLSTVIGPMVIGTLQNAEEIANAIDARGIRATKTHDQT